MNQIIRIGTRGSKLALWQASLVEKRLKENGIGCQLVTVESEGDQQQDKPLHEIGEVGLFTRMLDEVLRNNKIDIAVHSLKDVPTELPEDNVQVAVLPRGNRQDILSYKSEDVMFMEGDTQATIGTGSVRRKAQWLRKYPHHQVVGLRGNVQTRLRKLAESDWQGAVFARAGLERIELLPDRYLVLDWMIPAPAQGAIMVTARKGDLPLTKTVKTVLNDVVSRKMVAIEREFMRTLEGGCTSPIGAHAKLSGDQVVFKGGIYSVNGSREAVIEATGEVKDKDLGIKWAHKVLVLGGDSIIEEIRASHNL